MRTVVDKDGYNLLLKGNDMGGNEPAPLSEVDVFDVLVARVRGGVPIHVSGPLDDIQGRLHIDMINRLTRETGMYVRVIYN